MRFEIRAFALQFDLSADTRRGLPWGMSAQVKSDGVGQDRDWTLGHRDHGDGGMTTIIRLVEELLSGPIKVLSKDYMQLDAQ